MKVNQNKIRVVVPEKSPVLKMITDYRCDKCENLMELTDTDSRQEWVEETYTCEKCNKSKIHRTEFDQIGLVINDEIIENG